MTSTASSLELVAHAAGRLAGAAAMASPATRAAASIRQLSAVWDAYLRDAGVGDVGREHQTKNSGLFATHDPRRDGVLLWLVDHAGPALADGAATAVRAVGAKQRLGSEGLVALAIALELMPAVPDRLSATGTFEWLWAFVERLRNEPDFTETTGETVEVAVSTARLSTYRPAAPRACWAANLALAAHASSALVSIPAGTLSRLLFRLDLDRDEQRRVLADDWLRALNRSDASLWDIDRELRRGRNSLAHLSKNARARDAWALIVGTGGVARAQITKALSLSRGGAGVIVQHLIDADLVCPGKQGLLEVSQSQDRTAARPDRKMAEAAIAVDDAMANLDRLLAKMRG